MNFKEFASQKKDLLYTIGGIVVVLIAIVLIATGGNAPEEAETIEVDLSEIVIDQGASVIAAEQKPYVPPVKAEGTTFRLDSVNNVALSAGRDYTLSFSDDGNLSAKFCNQAFGAYEIANGVIRAENLAMTKMFCGEPSDLMALEQSFASVLSAGASFYIEGNTLIIRGGNGEKFSFLAQAAQ